MAKKDDKPQGRNKSAGGSMVADHPINGAATGNLRPVEEAAAAAGVPGWECAALMHAAGWAPGKQVDQDRFDAALERFRSRPTGGGRLDLKG